MEHEIMEPGAVVFPTSEVPVYDGARRKIGTAVVHPDGSASITLDPGEAGALFPPPIAGLSFSDGDVR